MIACLVTEMLTELHRGFKYPREILDFDFKNSLGVFLNNAIWDIEHGTVLKLCEGRYISHAIKGFRKLSTAEVRTIYGDPPRYD